MGVKIVSKSTLANPPKQLVANVISKLQQGNRAGDILFECGLQMDDYNGETRTFNPLTNDMRVISPRVLISVGSFNASVALSESLSKLYNTLVGSAYDTTSFNKADLGKHLIIAEGFTIALDMIDRFIDTYNVKTFINAGYSCLAKAQRFSYYHNGELLDFADLVAKRNTLIPNMNKLLLPSSIPWLNKHRYLFRHVYADDMHEKTQLIVPVPEVIYVDLDSNFDVRPFSVWDSGLRSATDIDVMSFIDTLYSYLQAYVESSFFKDMSPYLWRSMLQKNGPCVDKPVVYETKSTVLPPVDYDVIFDYDLIQLIRNADYIGIPMNRRGGSDFNIREDANENLTQGKLVITNTYAHYAIGVAPIMVAYATGHTITSPETADNITAQDLAADTNIKFAFYPTNSEHKFVNLEDFPSSDDSIYHALNCAVIAQPNGLGGIHNPVTEVTSSGDMIFTDIGIIFKANNTDQIFLENVQPVEAYYASVTANTHVYSTSTRIFIWGITTNNLLDIYNLLHTANCCPNIHQLFLRQDNSLVYKLSYVDKDNMIELPARSVANAHRYIMYSAMELNPSESSFEKGDPGNKYHKNKKNKKDKDGKNKEDKSGTNK